MKRKNTTRNALLSSIISLLLCVSMLVGTTFAWFTDSVQSGINQIAAGNLDVELYHSDKDDREEKVTAETKLFDDISSDLWEPGVVAYENFVVANEGSLALKYQLSINFENETLVNGHGLSEVLKVAVVEGGFEGDRADAQSLTDLVSLESFVLSGKLEGSEKSQTYGIVIYWEPSENDNLFNMNNENQGEILSIDLGVKLFATQEMYEEDSFGDDYDGAAPWITMADTEWYFAEPDAAEFTISSAEELAGLAALVNGTAKAPVITYAAGSEDTVQESFAGKTIKLSSNIDLAGHEWTPIGWFTDDKNNNNDAPFKGIIDGQGFTISNLKVNAPETNCVGLFGYALSAQFKNINIKNVDVLGYSQTAALVGRPYSGCSISNVNVSGDISIVSEYAYAGGIFAYGYTDIADSSVIGNADAYGVITAKTRNAVGGIVAWMLEGDNRITNCHVKNLELTGWTNIGGITGFVHYKNVIDGCSAENVNITKTREDGHPGVGMAAGGFSYSASNPITITNNTFKNMTFNGTYLAISSADILHGCEYAGNASKNFVTENNSQSGIENNLIEVKVIKNAAELKEAFANGGTYALANKVDVEDWTLELTEPVAVPAGKEVVLYMNGKTIACSSNATGKNSYMIDIAGDLTVYNGKITMEYTGADMGWGNCTAAFHLNFDGKLTLENVEAENLGGTSMAYVVDLTNIYAANDSKLLVKNSTLKSTYIPVRVFNNGDGKHNVEISDSLLEGKLAFWVQYYDESDHGMGDKTEAKRANLNIDIYNNGNTFRCAEGKTSAILYGFNVDYYFTAEGALIVDSPIVVPVAPLEEDFLFPAGTNAVIYQNMVMSGDAQIVHSENAVLGLSNVKAELDHDVIIRKSGGAIVIENSEFTLTDGAKLISVGEGGDAYQVFMVNVKINGVLMDDQTIWQYVEGISYISIVSEWPNT